MTLADFEKTCLCGPIGSLHPSDELEALSLVSSLAAAYQERVAAHAAEWRPKPMLRQRQVSSRRGFGVEMSLPKGDRDD